MQDRLICSRCGSENERPATLAKSSFVECQYVCVNCRCKDCSIVLGFECDCGERHADRDQENPDICKDCAIIRRRVASSADSDLLKLRTADIAREARIDALSAGYPTKQTESSLDPIPTSGLEPDSGLESTIQTGDKIS